MGDMKMTYGVTFQSKKASRANRPMVEWYASKDEAMLAVSIMRRAHPDVRMVTK